MVIIEDITENLAFFTRPLDYPPKLTIVISILASFPSSKHNP